MRKSFSCTANIANIIKIQRGKSLDNKKLETDLNKEKDEVKNYKKVLRYHKVKSSA